MDNQKPEEAKSAQPEGAAKKEEIGGQWDTCALYYDVEKREGISPSFGHTKSDFPDLRGD